MSNFNEEKDLEDRVREMAKLTMLSNKINSIQEKNIKMYPLVYFNGVSEVRIEYDLSNGRSTEDGYRSDSDKSYVSYDLIVDETQDNSKMDVRCAHIERAVRSLFWIDTKVIVKINNKKVFESHVK